MGKLVSIEKLEDGKTKITIERMPKTSNHYKIFLRRCGGMQHWVNVISENTINSKSFYDNTNDGVYWHINLLNAEDAKYEVVLDNSEWVSKHIKEIKEQLLHQEEQIIVNRAIKNQVKEITQAVRTNNYTSLIQNMIKQYADELTDTEVMEIQKTLTEIKENKGMISHQA
jgi:hypothetical protein